MEIIRTINKGSVMNTIERFHIHGAIKEGIYLNDIVTYVRFPWLNNVSTAVTMA
jgi:hypothetical protein